MNGRWLIGGAMAILAAMAVVWGLWRIVRAGARADRRGVFPLALDTGCQGLALEGLLCRCCGAAGGRVLRELSSPGGPILIVECRRCRNVYLCRPKTATPALDPVGQGPAVASVSAGDRVDALTCPACGSGRIRLIVGQVPACAACGRPIVGGAADQGAAP